MGAAYGGDLFLFWNFRRAPAEHFWMWARVPMICQYSTCAIVSSEGLEIFFCLEAPNEGCLVVGNMRTISLTSSLKPFSSYLPISQKSATGC